LIAGSKNVGRQFEQNCKESLQENYSLFRKLRYYLRILIRTCKLT